MVQNLTKFGWTIETLSISMKEDKKIKRISAWKMSRDDSSPMSVIF